MKHWVTEDFTNMSAVIGACPVKGNSSSVEYVKLAERSFELLSLDKRKIQAIVTDGATTMSCFSNHLKIKNRHCFAHNLQLCVNDFLSSFQGWTTTYTKMRKIFKFLHRSTTARKDYIENLKVNDLPVRILNKATPVRWGSTYLLCERFMDAKVTVEYFLVEYKKQKSLIPLLDEDWNTIEIVKRILQPINDATKTVQHCSSAPSSVIIPFVRVILLAYQEQKNCGESQILYNTMERRLSYYLKDEDIQVSCVLDPRFKINYLIEEDVITVQAKLELFVYEEMKKGNAEPVFTPLQEPTYTNNSCNFFEKFLVKNGQRTCTSPDMPEAELKTAAAREVQYYLSEPANITQSFKTYWKENAKTFPNLFYLARKYLAVPSTSSESERLFSAARMILSDYRQSMSPETLEQLLFLKTNSKFNTLDDNNNIGVSYVDA